eukprot:CAMPEP_0118929316 /NCGR_PEP_ID=MMETSP1169-20130426/6350_1 /TAXON_ID=36882 /ORGANISM="Pyramimonas obovata, Strain CCMP722" /LENGTH=193 /DNA_ID=CAMNT_0006871485 /DNA_START=55 /DNA_END=636 /DNA_ORIENTATION=-
MISLAPIGVSRLPVQTCSVRSSHKRSLQHSARPCLRPVRTCGLSIRSERRSEARVVVSTAQEPSLPSILKIGSSAKQILGETSSRAQAKLGAALTGATVSSLLAAPVANAEEFELWIQGASSEELAIEAGFIIALLFLVVLTGGVAYLSLQGWLDDRAAKEETEAAAARELRKRENAAPKKVDPTKPKGFGEK